MYGFFSQLTAYRKRFEGLQPKVVDLSHLPSQEAGGQIKGSELHGRLNAVHGTGLWQSASQEAPSQGLQEGGMTTGASVPPKAAAAQGG